MSHQGDPPYMDGATSTGGPPTAIGRPVAVTRAVWAHVVAMFLVVGRPIFVVIVAKQSPITGMYLSAGGALLNPVSIVGGVIVLAVWAGLVLGLSRGMNWTRITLTVIAAIVLMYLAPANEYFSRRRGT